AGVPQHRRVVAGVGLEVARLGAVPVEHCGDLAFAAGPAGCALAGALPDRRGQLRGGGGRRLGHLVLLLYRLMFSTRQGTATQNWVIPSITVVEPPSP